MTAALTLQLMTNEVDATLPRAGTDLTGGLQSRNKGPEN